MIADVNYQTWPTVTEVWPCFTLALARRACHGTGRALLWPSPAGPGGPGAATPSQIQTVELPALPVIMMIISDLTAS